MVFIGARYVHQGNLIATFKYVKYWTFEDILMCVVCWNVPEERLEQDIETCVLRQWTCIAETPENRITWYVDVSQEKVVVGKIVTWNNPPYGYRMVL